MTISRRRFVERLAIATGSMAVSSLSLSTADATSIAQTAARLAPYAKTGPLTDWTIDDMVGPYPRYAQVIACGRPSTGLVHSDPLDFL